MINSSELALLIPLSIIALADIAPEQAVFSDSNLRYSFTLPAGWAEIPKPMLEELNRNLSQQNKRPINFAAAFQAAGKQELTYPYILLSYRSSMPTSLVQLQQEILAGQKLEQEHLKSTGNEMQSMLQMKPVIDHERRLILTGVKATLDDQGATSVQGLTAYIPGRLVVVELGCFALKDEFGECEPQFQAVLSSVKFHEGFEFAEKKSNTSWNSRTLAEALVLSMGLLAFWAAWNQRKSAKKIPR